MRKPPGCSREWESVLDDLEKDVMLCRDRVDWVAKKFLLNTLKEEENLAWTDPWLQSIDLEYHNVSFDQGLHYALLREGQMRRFVSEDDIRNAIFTPPETTRAYFRGRSVAKFNNEVSSIHWDEVVFNHAGGTRRVSLNQAFNDKKLDRLNDADPAGEIVPRVHARDRFARGVGANRSVFRLFVHFQPRQGRQRIAHGVSRGCMCNCL